MDQKLTDNAEPMLSPLFPDPNADLTFKSSDCVLFKIHRKHLESTTGGFPAADVMVVDSEPVVLSEPADVLEVLFQFIEPPTETSNYRQPSVEQMKSRLFFAFAEAAEKYVVYGAMNLCITWMREKYTENPIQVLNHCARHGYTDLADEAAYASLRCPLQQIVAGLTHPSLLQHWVLYYDRWLARGRLLKRHLVDEQKSCPRCEKVLVSYFSKLLADASGGQALTEINEKDRERGGCCEVLSMFQHILLDGKPKFSNIHLNKSC